MTLVRTKGTTIDDAGQRPHDWHCYWFGRYWHWLIMMMINAMVCSAPGWWPALVVDRMWMQSLLANRTEVAGVVAKWRWPRVHHVVNLGWRLPVFLDRLMYECFDLNAMMHLRYSAAKLRLHQYWTPVVPMEEVEVDDDDLSVPWFQSHEVNDRFVDCADIPFESRCGPHAPVDPAEWTAPVVPCPRFAVVGLVPTELAAIIALEFVRKAHAVISWKGPNFLVPPVEKHWRHSGRSFQLLLRRGWIVASNAAISHSVRMSYLSDVRLLLGYEWCCYVHNTLVVDYSVVSMQRRWMNLAAVGVFPRPHPSDESTCQCQQSRVWL